MADIRSAVRKKSRWQYAIILANDKRSKAVKVKEVEPVAEWHLGRVRIFGRFFVLFWWVEREVHQVGVADQIPHQLRVERQLDMLSYLCADGQVKVLTMLADPRDDGQPEICKVDSACAHTWLPFQ